MGLCTAYYLLKAGREVTILTRDRVGVGASWGNAGMIVPSHVVPLSSPGVIAQGIRWLMRRDSPFHIKPRANLQLIKWLLRFRASATASHVSYAAPHLRDLSLLSLEAFDELAQELDDFALGHTGLMMVVSHRGRLPGKHEGRRGCRRCGLGRETSWIRTVCLNWSRP